MRKCDICGCSSAKDKDLSLHEIPAKLELREKWISALNLEDDGTVPERLLVCARHFYKDQIYVNSRGRRLLKAGAVPFRKLPVDGRQREQQDSVLPCALISVFPVRELRTPELQYKALSDLDESNSNHGSQTITRLQEDKLDVKADLRECKEKLQGAFRLIDALRKELNSARGNHAFQQVKALQAAAKNRNERAMFLYEQVMIFNNINPRYSEFMMKKCKEWERLGQTSYRHARTLLKLPSTFTREVPNVNQQ